MEKYKRKCSNWLTTYREWTVDRCMAPESFVFWSGIFCLSAAIRRRVLIPKSILGAWTCYPHTYILLVGDPGLYKNTSMGFADELLSSLVIERSPIFLSQAAIVDTIAKVSVDHSIYIFVEEFGDLILKGGAEMYEFLTSMYDGKKELTQKTMLRNLEFAQKPTINLFGGTTPVWIANNMPSGVIGGGLASRILFVFEFENRGKQLYFNKELKLKDYDKLELDLKADLNHISLNVEGEFMIEQKVMDWMEKWDKEKNLSGNNPKLKGYFNRKATHVHKIAQLVHLAYSDDLILEQSDFEAAINIVESIEPNLPRVFAGVGKNTYSFDMMDMVEFIRINPGVRRDILLNHFRSNAEPNKLQELVDGLLVTGIIKSELDSNQKLIYRII